MSWNPPCTRVPARPRSVRLNWLVTSLVTLCPTVEGQASGLELMKRWRPCHLFSVSCIAA